MDSTATDPIVGCLLDDRYHVRRQLARGGMATVYEGDDTRLQRTVAVKVMHPAFTEDAEFVRRFHREAQSAAVLSHPNLVAVFDQGHDEGTGADYLTMEYVPGSTLRDLLAEHGRLDPESALEILEPMLEALAAAHHAGMIHRDVKPENILLGATGEIKVADFGLARAITAATATQGKLIGTVSYLAPEQLVGERTDARSDVYAAGVVLYEMLTGSKPHRGENPIQVAYKHVNEDVDAPSTRVPGLPGFVDGLVLRSTARDPHVRPADARVLVHHVRRARVALRQGVDDPELAQDLLAFRLSAAPEDEAPEGSGLEVTGDAAGVPAPSTVKSSATGPPKRAPGARAQGNKAPARKTPAKKTPAKKAPAKRAAGEQARGKQDPAKKTPGQNTAAKNAPGSKASGTAAKSSGKASSGETGSGKSPPAAPAGKRPPAGRGTRPASSSGNGSPRTGSGSTGSGSGPESTAVTPLAPASSGLGGTRTIGTSGGPKRDTQRSDRSVQPRRPSRDRLGGGSTRGAGRNPGARPRRLSRRMLRRRRLVASVLLFVLVVGSGFGYWYGVARYTEVPDLTELSAGQVKSKARASDLRVDTARKRVWHDEISTGHVVSVSPSPGERVLRGETLRIVLSRGVERHELPDLVGKDLRQARTALQQRNLELAPLRRVYRGDAEKGEVVGMTPEKGKVLVKGSSVRLTVSRGPAPVDVPSVTGEPLASATTTLRDIGLEVQDDTAFSDTVPEGKVVSQRPKPGEAHRGDTVRLVVSKGPEFRAVPDVTSSSVEDAKQRLTKLGFEVDVTRTDLYVGANLVVGQSPKPGKELRQGETVTVEIV